MTNNKNVYLDLDEITGDFGFTFASSDDVLEETPEYSSAQEEVNDLKQRLLAINKIYMPLLENLNKDPDKDFIKWPGRKAVLDKQISKLKALTNI
jgi:hypothetical protein